MTFADRMMYEWRALEHQQSLMDRLSENDAKMRNYVFNQMQSRFDFLMNKYMPAYKQENRK